MHPPGPTPFPLGPVGMFGSMRHVSDTASKEQNSVLPPPLRLYIRPLAAVTQPRLGSDWAGLCAAAVAAAFTEDATPASITETVLRIAHRVNKDVFYQLNLTTIQSH